MINVVSPQDARKLIEDIQRSKTGYGLKGLEDPVTKKAWEDKNRELNRALRRLSEDLYKKKTHFVMELIQNAEDNTYNPDIQPYLRFFIKSDTLIVSNNEAGFNREDVENICSVGQTAKSKKKGLGYIGEKGIGFKSVFKISPSPKIISNNFQFEFRHSDSDDLGYIVPYWLPTIPDGIDPQVTTIILPLREDARDQLDLFETIDPTLILFLRKLQRIEIVDNTRDTFKTVTKSEDSGLVTLECQGQSQCWRIIRLTLNVPLEVAEQDIRRQGVSNTEVVLAFPVSEMGHPTSIRKEPTSDIFAFLPVKKCGFSFVIQANFLLTSDREDILQDSQWNRWLLSNIPDAMFKALEEFKRDEDLKLTFFKYFSPPEEIGDEFFNPLMHQAFQVFSNVECILTESGSWRRPCEVYYAEEDLKALIPNDELRSNFGKEYVADTFYLKKELRDLLGIANFTPKCLIECLKRQEWVKKHPDEWIIQLYRYCAQQLEKPKPGNLTRDDILQLPILKLEDGDYWSAKSGLVFLYLEKTGKKYGFELDLKDSLKVLDAGIRRAIEAGEDANDLIAFLEELGVVSPDPGNIVKEHILPQYRTNAWEKKPPEVLQGHIHFIKDHFRKLQKIEGLTETIGKEIRLRVNGEQNQISHLCPEQIYLSDEYECSYRIPSIMAAAGETFFLENSLHPCYVNRDLKDIDAKIKQIREEAKPKKGRRAKKQSQVKKEIKRIRSAEKPASSWREFVLALGVHEGIRVVLDPETELYEGDARANCEVTRKRIWVRELSKTLWRESNWIESDSSYFVGDDYVSEDLSRIFGCFDEATPDQKKDISLMLFGLFLDNWDKYREYIGCTYYYRRSNQRGWRSSKTQSTFLLQLRKTPWAVTTDGGFAPLESLFIDSDQIKEILGSSARYIGFDIDPDQNAQFLEDVRIRTEVNIGEVIEVIAGKVRSGSESIEEFKNLYLHLQGLIPPKDYSRNPILQFQKPKPAPEMDVFRERRLILIPGTDQKYFTAGEVFWRSNLENLKEYLPSLEPWYPECRNLFVDNIGAKVSPAPEDLVLILEQIARIAEISAIDEQMIITIYKEFNETLKQKAGSQYSQWLKDFVNKRLLWVNKKEFRRNNDVFVNDDHNIYDLFADREDIAFLGVNTTDLRDLKDFIKYAKIPRVSESVKCTIIGNSHQIHRDAPELTQRIQNLIPYILRYLYNKHQKEYDHLKETRKLNALYDIRCLWLDRIDVKYTLRDETARDTRDVLLEDNILYVSEDDQLKIAMEFLRFFGDIENFGPTVCQLFTYEYPERVKEFFEIAKIAPLPPDEEEWIISLRAVDEMREIPVSVALEERSGEDRAKAPALTMSTTKSDSPPEGFRTSQDDTASTPDSPLILSSAPVTESVDTDVSKSTYQSHSGRPQVPRGQKPPQGDQDIEEIPIKQESEEIDKLLDRDPASINLTYIEHPSQQKKDGSPNQKDSSPSLEEPEKQVYEPERYRKDQRPEIGHWGEETVYLNLQREMQERYPSASVIDTDDGFTLSHSGKSVIEVIWYNKVRRGGDRGYGHDIKIIESGSENYIEVKTSVNPGGVFMVSKNEWDLAKESGDRYFIYHVYQNPQDNKIACKKIQDPVGKWQKGELEARMIQVVL